MTTKKPAKRAGAPAPRPPSPGAALRSPRTPQSSPSAHQNEPQDTITHEVAQPPAFTPKGLTPLQHRFAQEYLVDLCATKAYSRASPDVTYETAQVEGSRLLGNPMVAAEIQRLMDERAAITGITADRVLLRLWEIATADARKLIEYHVGACRHCWGLYNQYQYTDAEFGAAHDKHIREESKRRKAEGGDYTAKDFPEKGGSGFDPAKPPNPECPECWGDGKGRPIIHDTRHLGPGEAALFSGIKVTRTRDGETVNVLTKDQAVYWQMIGRHLGMWNDKLKVVDETNPLQALIQEIQQAHSTLPIVAKDPERRHVTDVEPKAQHTHSAPGADSPMKKGQKPANWRPVK